jgi:hypothetical protein
MLNSNRHVCRDTRAKIIRPECPQDPGLILNGSDNPLLNSPDLSQILRA